MINRDGENIENRKTIMDATQVFSSITVLRKWQNLSRHIQRYYWRNDTRLYSPAMMHATQTQKPNRMKRVRSSFREVSGKCPHTFC